MADWEIAKEELRDGQSLIVVKDGVIVLARAGRGIRPLYEIIVAPERSADLFGASLADKVFGKAAALLCVSAQIKAVYAALLSKPAAAVLEANGIPFECGQMVPFVLNRTRSDSCPVEKLVGRLDTPAAAIAAIGEFLQQTV